MGNTQKDSSVTYILLCGTTIFTSYQGKRGKWCPNTKQQREETMMKVKIFAKGISNSVVSSYLVKSYSEVCFPSSEIDRICNIINDHSFPHPTMESTLRQKSIPFSTALIENVLGRLFTGHANGLKALQFFHWTTQQNPSLEHTTWAYERMLHMLVRMRAFGKAWELLEEMSFKKKITLKALSIVLFAYARRKSFDETLEAFERMGGFVAELNTDTFNVLLKAFCSNRNMKQARFLFNKMHDRFGANKQTFNILLLGFKESGNAVAVEVFFREMHRRGFDPDIVTYNIVVDALCKTRRIDDAFELVKVIKTKGCRPNIWTYTTLIHGLGIVKNKSRACELFAELKRNGFEPDTAVYNALICCFCKSGDVKGGLRLVKEMEKEGVDCDNVTYHTLLSALQKLGKEEGVCELFGRMMARDHVPTAATAIMLMKFFCSSGLHERAFQLWDYVVRKGCCPHGHVSNLLITELCYSGKLDEACNCFSEILGKGLHPYKQSFDILQKFYREAKRENQLLHLEGKMEDLQSCLPASEEYVSVLSESKK